MRRNPVDIIAPVAFALGVAVLVFAWGFAAGKNRVFPYETAAQAEDAARSFWQAYLRPDFRASASYVRSVAAPAAAVLKHEVARTAPGLTLIVGYRPGQGFSAWMVDADGNRVHEWRARFSEVFPEAPHLLWNAGDEAIAWHGTHLFPNGDLLFNFHGNNFPYGGGLVKLDKDSKVLWKLPRNTHHAVQVLDDGTIWVPSMYFRPEGIPETPNLKPWYYEDTLLEVAPDGRVRREISVLKALLSYPGLLSVNYREDLAVETEDPFHNNDVDALPAAWADRFPLFEAGDLLVSLRSINTIAVIDPRTERVKWALAGPFAKQHSPNFLPNGHIMLFDNRGGDPACGGSRVLELDPVTQATVWKYDACGDRPFFTDLRGLNQALPNGNVLVTESHGGRVFEVTHEAAPKIVWEYYNLLGERDGDRASVGVITHAERFPREALTFLPAPAA